MSDILIKKTKYYKKKPYLVIMQGMMKNPNSGKWRDCVIYTPLYQPVDVGNSVFVRDAEDFYEKFRDDKK